LISFTGNKVEIESKGADVYGRSSIDDFELNVADGSA